MYVNMGDPYRTTILFDGSVGEFIVGNWGDHVEEKEREYEAKQTKEDDMKVGRMKAIAARLNREYATNKGTDQDEGIRLRHNMLLAASDELSGLGWLGTLNEEKGLDVEYVNFGERSEITLICDGTAEQFLVGDPHELIERKTREYESQLEKTADTSNNEPDHAAIKRGDDIAAIRTAVRDGESVYIGEREYYVYSTNNSFANLYAMDELEALPDVIGEYPEERPFDWEALANDPFDLTRAIRNNRFPVTDYFLDIEDFRRAVISNRRNLDISRRMDITRREAGPEYSPALQTNGSPYYTVGDSVFLDGDKQNEIQAVSGRYVWSVEKNDGKEASGFRGENADRMSIQDFERQFFANPLNNEAISLAKTIERVAERFHTPHILDLNSFAEMLNRERADKKTWRMKHPEQTIRELLQEVAEDIDYCAYGSAGEGKKNTDLRIIDVYGQDESLIYDYVTDKFMAGKFQDVVRAKEHEYEAERARFESLAERLNDKLSRPEESDARNHAHLVTDLLAEANKEIGGNGVLIFSDEEYGVYIRYVDLSGTEYRQTILYDGNQKTFLVDNWRDLAERQEHEYSERQRKKAGLENDEPEAAAGGNEPAKRYELNYGHMGNGLTVWNCLEERGGDYVTVAHIASDRTVKFYDENLPDSIKEQILHEAKTSDARISATQDIPVFSTPPQIEQQSPVLDEISESQPDTTTETTSDLTPSKSILDDLDWPKPRNKTEEFRQEFTKKIIGLMEQGEAFWQKPWTSPEVSLPCNAKTGNRYNGVNIVYLMVSSMAQHFTDPRWMTYKQADEAGYHVKQGEKGTKIEFYTEYDPSKTKKGAENTDRKIQEMMDRGASPDEIENALEDQKKLIVKTYSVFNAQQIEGIEPINADIPENGDTFRYHDRAESIMDNCGVPIRYGSPSAAYSPSRDEIRMPNREWFTTPEYFYATALHEISHSTGHTSRMNRDITNSFGTEAYAMEELRAEMASAFVFQDIGMSVTPEDMEEYVKEHAAYTQNWLKTLKDDYKEFYKATRDAVKIADYVLAYDRTLEKANEASHAADEAKPVPTTAYPQPEQINPTQTPEVAKGTNPVQAAKALIGQSAIVTNAQKGKTYTGDIVQIGSNYAIQKIGPERGVIHNLNKITDPNELTALLQKPKEERRVSISYDNEHRASLKKQSREEERETAVTR
jgi:antirestriction protein ArdC